jgi:hypothetical protein
MDRNATAAQVVGLLNFRARYLHFECCDHQQQHELLQFSQFDELAAWVFHFLTLLVLVRRGTRLERDRSHNPHRPTSVS